MARHRRSLSPLAAAALGLALLGAALSCARAGAEEPLAEIAGLPEGEVLGLVRSTIGTADAPAQTPFEARRRASRARDRAIAALRSEGYYGARVEPQVIQGRPPRALIEIDPGERFVIGAVQVEVSGETSSALAQRALRASGLERGKPARAQDVIEGETRAVAAIEAQGYPDVATLDRSITVDHARKEMDVTLRLASGRAAVLGVVRGEGTARLRPGYLARVAPFRPGDEYDRRALETLAGRLRDTGAFESVSVRLAPPEGPGAGPEERDVIADVTSGPRRSFTLGAGYSTSEGVGVESSWARRNQLGVADTLTFTLTLKDIEQRLTAELALPHWRVPGRTLRLTSALSAEETDAYDRDALDFAARADNEWSERLSGAVGAGVTLSEVRESGTDQGFTLLYATGSVAWDGADDLLDPKRGMRASASTKPTAGFGANPVAYVVAEVAGSAYHSFGERVTLAARGRLGDIFGPPIDEIPADERFFAGGGGSIRGYEYQSVGPKNAAGEPIGGRSIVEVSGEVRYRTKGRIGYVAFIDGGAASEGLSPSLDELRWGAGVGVRYFTRLGPIRADIAAPIDRRSDEPSVQFYFNIGQAF